MLTKAKQEAATYTARIKQETAQIRKLEEEERKTPGGRREKAQGRGRTAQERAGSAACRRGCRFGGDAEETGNARAHVLRRWERAGYRELCLQVYRKSLCGRRHESHKWGGLLRLCDVCLQKFRHQPSQKLLFAVNGRQGRVLLGCKTRRCDLLWRTCRHLHRKRADCARQYGADRD